MEQQKNTLTEKEQGEYAIETLQLLYKLNTIAIKMRRTGQGFLQSQKPADHEFDAVEIKDKDDFVAIMKVDFPSETYQSQFGETAGTLSWMTNRKYPMRGFSVAETVSVLTMFKKMFRLTLEKLSRYKFRVLLMGLFFRKPLEDLAKAMILGFSVGMGKHLLKEDRYCQPVREIRRVFAKFAIEDKVSEKTRDEQRFPESIVDSLSALLEFDDAYRYRFQWLPWETKAIAKSPVKELRRMFNMLLERESDDRLAKQWKIFKQASWLLAVHRPLRKAVKRFFNELNANEIKLSVEDRYHAVSKGSFQWGLPSQESYIETKKEV